MRKIIVATCNEHKIKEIREILAGDKRLDALRHVHKAHCLPGFGVMVGRHARQIRFSRSGLAV